MGKEITPVQPPDIPQPGNPEIIPGTIPDQPASPGKPEIAPVRDPNIPAAPPEIPGGGPA